MLGESIREFVFSILEDTHTALPARIDNFDDSNMRAEVELLEENQEGEAPIIVDVPVMTFRAGGLMILPPYQSGDTGVCIFSESALEGPLYDGSPRPDEFDRNHELDDAIFMGGLVPDRSSVSVGGDSENLRIGSEDGDVVMEFDKSGEIKMSVDTLTVDTEEVGVDSSTIELGNGTLNALMKATVQQAVNQHVHNVSGTTSDGASFSTQSSIPTTTLISSSDITVNTVAS